MLLDVAKEDTITGGSIECCSNYDVFNLFKKQPKNLSGILGLWIMYLPFSIIFSSLLSLVLQLAPYSIIFLSEITPHTMYRIISSEHPCLLSAYKRGQFFGFWQPLRRASYRCYGQSYMQ